MTPPIAPARPASASELALTGPPRHPWDDAAEGWNQHTALIRAWLRDATAAMLDAARIGPGASVLDIAAGAGDQTLDIARIVGPAGRVLATDIAPRILALAQRNAAAAGLPQVATRVADAQALGLAGFGFDAAVCRLGLMFCPAPHDALAQARAALRPGGRFAALVFSAPQRNPCLAILMSTALRHAGLPARSPYAPGSLMSLGGPGELERLLHAAGFTDVSVQVVAAPFRLPTRQRYLDFVRSAASPVIEILAPLSADAQRAAWDDMALQLSAFDTADGWEGPNELLLGAGSC